MGLELDLVQLLPGLLLTLLGVALYIVSPETTTDEKDKARHLILAVVAFVLLFLTGAVVNSPAGAVAYFSAGVAPNMVVDLYKASQAGAK